MECIFVALYLRKDSDLHLEPSLTANYKNQGRHKIYDYVANNKHSGPLKECIHSEVCHSFRSTYMEPFQHIGMRKQNITFKSETIYQLFHHIRFFHTNRGTTVKLTLGEYHYLKAVKKTQR